jgi:sulfatase maturation enzyme AslB (radical SAM superfamily)
MKELDAWSRHCNGQIYILTTGLLLRDYYVRLFAHNPNITIQVTFDGFSQSDIAHLMWINLHLVKQRVIEAAKSLNIVLNYTLHTKNIDSIGSLIEFAVRSNIRVLYISKLLVYRSCVDAIGNYAIDIESPAVQDKLIGFKQRGEALGLQIILPKQRLAVDTDEQLVKHCRRIGGANPIVHADGRVSICWGREDLFIGQLPHQSLCDILRSELFGNLMALLSQGRLATHCQECLIRFNSKRDILLEPTI